MCVRDKQMNTVSVIIIMIHRNLFKAWSQQETQQVLNCLGFSTFQQNNIHTSADREHTWSFPSLEDPANQAPTWSKVLSLHHRVGWDSYNSQFCLENSLCNLISSTNVNILCSLFFTEFSLISKEHFGIDLYFTPNVSP